MSELSIDSSSSSLMAISKNKKKLMKLASEVSSKTKKKTTASMSNLNPLKSSKSRALGDYRPSNHADPAHSPNIEHLVFGSYRSRPSPTPPVTSSPKTTRSYPNSPEKGHYSPSSPQSPDRSLPSSPTNGLVDSDSENLCHHHHDHHHLQHHRDHQQQHLRTHSERSPLSGGSSSSTSPSSGASSPANRSPDSSMESGRNGEQESTSVDKASGVGHSSALTIGAAVGDDLLVDDDGDDDGWRNCTRTDDQALDVMEETLKPDNISFFLASAETSFDSGANHGVDFDCHSNRDLSSNNGSIRGRSSGDHHAAIKSKIPVPSACQAISFNSALEVPQQSVNCGDSSNNVTTIAVQSSGQLQHHPLRLSHVKTRDSLRQSARSKKAAERSRAILRQIADEIQKQNQLILSANAEAAGTPLATSSSVSTASKVTSTTLIQVPAPPPVDTVSPPKRDNYDPRRYFRRQNSLPVYIPKSAADQGHLAGHPQHHHQQQQQYNHQAPGFAQRGSPAAATLGGDAGNVTLVKRTPLFSPVGQKVFGVHQPSPSSSIMSAGGSFRSDLVMMANGQLFAKATRSPMKQMVNGLHHPSYAARLGLVPVASPSSRPPGPPPPYEAHHCTVSATKYQPPPSYYSAHDTVMSSGCPSKQRSGSGKVLSPAQLEATVLTNGSSPNLVRPLQSSRSNVQNVGNVQSSRPMRQTNSGNQRRDQSLVGKQRSLSLTNETRPPANFGLTAIGVEQRNRYAAKLLSPSSTDTPRTLSSKGSSGSKAIGRTAYGALYVMDEDHSNFSSPKMINQSASPYMAGTFDSLGRKGGNSTRAAVPSLLDTLDTKEYRREIIDATGSVPTSTFSSPEKRSQCPSLFDDLAIYGRPRSSSEHQLSALLLSDAQKKSLGYPVTPPEKPPRIYQSVHHHRPWSQLVTDRDIESLQGQSRELFGLPTYRTGGPLVRKQKSDTDVSSHRPRRGSTIVAGFADSMTETEAALVEHAESSAAVEVDSMMQKFKKSFSLRFSRRQGSTRAEATGGVKNKLRQSLRAKSVEGRLRDVAIREGSSEERERCPPDGGSDDQGPDGQVVLRHMSCVQRKRSVRGLRRSLSQPQNMEKMQAELRRDQSKDSLATGTMTSESSAQASSESESDSEGHRHRHREERSRAGHHHHLDSAENLDESEVIYVEAVWDHLTSSDVDDEELSFRAGEVIEVTDSSDRDWWWGSIGPERCGWFPVTHVRTRVNQDETVEECMSKLADGTATATPKKRMSISLLSNEQVRSNCILEIISTERDFVKHLNDVVEGYLVPIRRHKEMFTEERIGRIFGNVEQLYKLQVNFLEQLETCINWDKLSDSTIGRCFLEHEQAFVVYSDYCNNHPLAVAELQELFVEPKYAHFFEACRLLRNMIDISLDGFLLTPVQKICKYPLQLAELLKYTRADHPDHGPVKAALAAMQRVAQLVNDRKRRIESLEQLYVLQKLFDNWEGTLLTETSSITFRSGEVTRVTSNWSQTVTLFLFDRLLVYCKKSGLGGKRYIYKGRVDMDMSTKVEVPDDGTRDALFSVTCKNAIKIYCGQKDKWFMFVCKSAEERQKWVRSFQEERQQLIEDTSDGGFVITDKERAAAQAYLVNRSKPRPVKSSKALSKKPKPRRPDTAIAEVVFDPEYGLSKGSRAGSLPSYLNPAVAVSSGGLERGQAPLKKKGSGWFHLGSSKTKKGSKRRPEVTRIN